MNKIFKVIWNKSRNCWVAVAEFAKSHTKSPSGKLAKSRTKSPKSEFLSRTLAAGILACVMNFGVMYDVLAADTGNMGWSDFTSKYNFGATGWTGSTDGDEDAHAIDAYIGVNKNDGTIIVAQDRWNYGGYTHSVDYVSLGAAALLDGNYTAGTGISISDSVISAKAGTGITVNSSGISITAGSIASGNENAITGDTAYSELRPADNGNYVKTAQTTAQNLTALDTQVKANATASGNAIKGLSVSGKTITYTKNDGTTGTITTQDNDTTYTAGNGLSLSGTSFSVKAGTNVTVNSNGVSVTGSGSVASGNTGLINGGTAYTELRPTADGTFVKKANTTAANLTALDTAGKNAIKGLSVSGKTITYTKGDGTTGTINTQDTTYTAGSGLSLSGTTFSVNTNGSVSSGNTGVVNGGTVYSEVRPTADGTFVKKANTTAANLTALDTASKNAIKGLSVNGKTITYTKNDGTTGTINTQDTTYTAGSGLSLSGTTFSVNTNGSVASGNTGVLSGGTAYTELRPADGSYVKKANTTAANLKALDTQTKANTDAIASIDTNKADNDGSNAAAYAQQWANAIGTGKVAANDTKLVTGKTVYNALHDTNGEIVTKTLTSDKVTTKELVTETLEVNKEATFHDNATFEKDIVVQGTTTTKTLHVTENATVDGDLTVSGKTTLQDLLVKGDFTVEGDQVIDGKTKTKELEVDENATIGGDLDVKGKSTFEDDVTMQKNLDVAGNGSFGGDLTVAGKTTLQDILSVAGDADFQSNANVGKDLSVAGTSNLHDTNVDGKLDVTGESVFHENVTVDKDLAVVGTSNLHDTNVDGKLDVTGESAFHDNVTMDKDLSVAGTSNLHDTNVDGKLDVTGESAFHDNVAMDKDLALAGNGDIGGNITVGGTSEFTGASTFKDNVTMEKDLSVAGNSDVAGNGHFGGGLTVDGRTTLKDMLSVEGDADLQGNANVGKDLSVAGTSNLHDTNIDGKLDVTGESTFHDNVAMDKDLAVAGTSNLHDTNIDGKLDVTGESAFHDNVAMDKDLAVAGTSNLYDTNIDGKLNVTGESAFYDNVTMDKDLSVAGNGDIAGNLTVGGTSEFAGASTFKDNVTMEKDLSVAGNSDVAGNGHFGGELTVDGKTTLKDTLSVAGDAEFQGNASVAKDFSVAGTSDLHDTNIDGKLDVTGQSAFHDNVSMDKDLAVAGNGDIAGNLKVGGTSEFTGASTFKDKVTMKKDLSVAGNSDVAGNGHFGKDLKVDGKTTLKDILSVAGDAEFKKNASVGKDFSVAGKSDLHDTNIDGKLDVAGPSHFKDNVTMDKDLAVAGNSDLKGDVNIGGDLRADNGTSYFDKSIWHEGEENQVEINETGIRVGLNSTHMDAHGVYAGGHNWDEAKAAMHEDGRIKGIYGYLEKDLEVGGKTTTGELEVKGDANVGGKLTADQVVTNDIQLPGGSLNSRLDKMDDRIDKVGAGAAALAGLQYAEFDPGSKFSMALGMGSYKGSIAGAIGGQYHFSKNVSMNIAGTVGNGENMVSGGLTFKFGKPKTQTEKDNDVLRDANKKLMKRLEMLEKRMEGFSLIEQKKAAFPDIPSDHWARNSVETLKGNGFVEGYPDGEFKGDKRMTRYEYAQMLYRALSKGATVEEEHLKEFEPELRQIEAEQKAQEKMAEAQAPAEVPVVSEAQPVMEPQPEQVAQEAPSMDGQAATETVAPAPSELPPMAPGMSRMEYAQQIFGFLKGGGAIDSNLAKEYEPELKQIIQEERAKGTIPQQ